MVETTMPKYGYQSGKDMALCSQRIMVPITLLGNKVISNFGYK